ncbi:MAG: D-alanyl-D-alanine carboxypeptidase [Alphaproteobacteria bacterium]|nr:D-alanyl-D-alanine carboxypeptidase [Alphaproteobacteria bacterium]
MKLSSKLLSSIAFCGFVFSATHAQSIETKARNLILMDYDTGQYLHTKDAEKMIPPASMSKLMTVYMLFNKLGDGTLSLDDTFTVSENAWRKGGAASGGSTMFLAIGDKVRVEDLLKGIIIQSGNDACIVVAENLAGTEEDFAADMNAKAQEIGLTNSHFANATGLPHPDHRMSVEDLAKLSRRIISEYPQYYHLFSMKEFVYRNIRQGNRNPLLYSMPYADGLKTGHTEEAGYCLTASAKKDGRRLIGVMTGLNSNKERSEEAERIMSWGFREFNNYKLLNKGHKVADIPVWYGVQPDVSMVVSEDVVRTLKRNQKNDVKLKASYDKPVKAPVKKGQQLGVVKVEIPNQPTVEIPLIAAADVAEVGLFGRIRKNISYLLLGSE